MKTRIMRFLTGDGFELHGILFEPEAASKMVVVHVHGLAGNFYENGFLYHLAQRFTSDARSFFVFNNRGHDYIADVNHIGPEGSESLRLGAAYEHFGDCVKDIDGALAFLASCGYSKFVIQGHSTGANKVVYYQSRRHNGAVVGIVLLSPCDDIALQESSIGARRHELLRLADDMVKRGEGKGLMPEGAYFSYPLSAQTFLDYFREGAEQDVFPYRTPDAEFADIAALRVHIFASFGGDGDYTIGTPEDTLTLLSQKAINAVGFAWRVIPGCGHSYSGGEVLLGDEVCGWLNKVVGTY